jgi:ribokinase
VITVFGSANLDLIGQVSRIPSPGETVPGSTFSTAAGGKGANQALAARRAGSEVQLVAAVGTDSFADEALALLRADGVNLMALRRADGPTGIAMIFVDPEGENVIAILPGANGTMSPADADNALSVLPAGATLLLQQEVPQAATRRALDIGRTRGLRTILNTAPFLETTPEVAAMAEIVIANETEFELLGGRRAAGQTMIVTLGAEGARAITDQGEIAVPALKVTPVDTVGAGDTFCGYLAEGLDRRLSLKDAMRRAAVAGSLATTRPGAQPSIPQADEVARSLGSR